MEDYRLFPAAELLWRDSKTSLKATGEIRWGTESRTGRDFCYWKIRIPQKRGGLFQAHCHDVFAWPHSKEMFHLLEKGKLFVIQWM